MNVDSNSDLLILGDFDEEHSSSYWDLTFDCIFWFWTQLETLLRIDEKCLSSYWALWLLVADFGFLANVSTVWDINEILSATFKT